MKTNFAWMLALALAAITLPVQRAYALDGGEPPPPHFTAALDGGEPPPPHVSIS